MQILRVIGVWLVALSLTSLLVGGAKGFLVIFLIYGMFMTLPALGFLALTLAIERVLIRRDRPVMAVALGPVMGLIVPAALFVIAPNKGNALSAVSMLALITVGTGLLWALTYLLMKHRYRSDPAADKA